MARGRCFGICDCFVRRVESRGQIDSEVADATQREPFERRILGCDLFEEFVNGVNTVGASGGLNQVAKNFPITARAAGR